METEYLAVVTHRFVRTQPGGKPGAQLGEKMPLDQCLNNLVHACHSASVDAGWWPKLPAQPDIIGWKLALIHSEVSEATEGFRKDIPDDKLPQRKMAEVELADAIIRICDLAGACGFDLGGALVEKLAYNAQRADHKPENRAAAGGKKF